MVPGWLRQPRYKRPARPAFVSRALLIALASALIITTSNPTAAEAKARPYIELNRIDQRVVVEGHNFPKKAKGIAKIRVAGIFEQKNVRANSKGYFRVTFYKVKPDTAGKAWAGAWINNKIRRTAEKTLKPVGGNGVIPTTTTTSTTVAPTTTTAPPTTTTAKPVTTTTKAPVSGQNGGSTGGSTSGSVDTSKWRLAVQDDFNGSSINSELWGLYEGKGNEGVGERKRSAVTVSGGSAHINGRGWVGGGMALKEQQTYGKYEIRSRMDNGAGYNKAELLWPSSERWPRDVEIDISEIFDGSYDQFGSFVHYGIDHKRLHKTTKDVNTSQWHTYGVEWEPSKVTYFFDGKPIWTVTEPAAIPHTKHFLGIQLDVSRSSHKVNTSLHVDYVKVWERV